MVTLDYVNPLTGYEPKDMELTDANERNLATSSDIYFQNALDDTASFPNVPDVDDDELTEFLAVVVDRTGQPVEVRSNNDQFSCDIRNLKSAQSQFPLVTQPKRMISQTGGSVEERIAEERESSNAQIRTMLDEQRRTIIAEYGEKVLHHELLAAQAEQDSKILQEELLRQQQDFREVHQQDLMKMKELQKFQNSTFDEFTKQKFIEDQKIIMELSGRLQKLQNEVNCMNDSKDVRDAESICSGSSHVTSPPGLFPRHPPFEGLLKPAFISQRQTEEPPNVWDTSGISGNVFAHPQTSSSAPYPQESNSTWKKTIEEPIHMSTAEKSGRHKLFQESRTKDSQEIEELRRRCCEESDRARQAKLDELSMMQQRDPQTVSQLLAQMRESQDKVNSLSDTREFHDPETAGSSGAFHVTSPPLTNPSYRTVPRRDSGLPPETLNMMGISDVFERLPAREGQPQNISKNHGIWNLLLVE